MAESTTKINELPPMLYDCVHIATNSRFSPGDEIVFKKSYSKVLHRGVVLGRNSNERGSSPVHDETDRTVHWYQVAEHGRVDGWIDFVHDRSILYKCSVLDLLAEAAA